MEKQIEFCAWCEFEIYNIGKAAVAWNESIEFWKGKNEEKKKLKAGSCTLEGTRVKHAKY